MFLNLDLFLKWEVSRKKDPIRRKGASDKYALCIYDTFNVTFSKIYIHFIIILLLQTDTFLLIIFSINKYII